MNGAEFLVRTLRQRGVDRVFVLCGNGLRPFLDACIDAGLPLIDARNEQAAAFMADSWGRLTGRLGVAAVSAGPGHTNALAGLVNAYFDGGPMLLLSGASSGATRGLGQFQELDQVAMAAPVCKYAARIDRADVLAHELAAAVAAATTGRPGPVHLTVPLDVLAGPVPEPAGGVPPPPAAICCPRAAPDAEQLAEAAAWLSAAARPVIVLGSGAFYAGAGAAARALAERLQLPVFSLMWDRGCVDTAWPEYVGVTSTEVNGAAAALGEADLVVSLGARVDYRLNFGEPPLLAPEARFLRVDADAAELARGGAPPGGGLSLLADPRSAAEALLAAVRPPTAGWDDWLERVRGARAALIERWEPYGRDESWPVASLRICRELRPFLDQDVTFCLDGGNIGRWAHLALWDRHPAHWHTCGASGVVGWGLPGAMAARMARPDHPVLLLSGDGAAGFTPAEIETALRFRTPYVAVVAHDAAWGIEADHQPEGRRQATELGILRFDRLAVALGARGVAISQPSDLGPAIAAGLAADTVTVIHVPTRLGGIAAIEREAGGGDATLPREQEGGR